MDYNRLVVPLDGSKLAEIALPHAEKIAKACSVPHILLITVTERIRVKTPKADLDEQTTAQSGPSVIMFDEFFALGSYVEPSSIIELPETIGKMAKTGYNYLTRIAEKMTADGFKVGIAVLSGNVAEEIVSFSERAKADLIIMASRGRRSFRSWDVANAALGVFRSTEIPVLMVKPPKDFVETKPKRKGEPL